MKRGYDTQARLRLFQVIVVIVIFSILTSASIPISAQSGGALSYGSRVYGTVSSAAPRVTYRFSGQQGDAVAIAAVSWTGTLDIRLDVVAPDGTVVNISTQDTALSEPLDAALSVVLPESGVYVLRLSGDGGTEGDFLLTIAGRAAVTAAPLAYGQAVDVTVAPGASPQYFAFEAEHCPTTLIVTDQQGQRATFPAAVKVQDQRGQPVAFVRVGQTLEDRVTVEADSGRYEVEVGPADDPVSGALRLIVTCSGDAPGCPTGSVATAGGTCEPCPSLDEWMDGSGCPDLGLQVESDDAEGVSITATWTPMDGADGYVVYVTGTPWGGGEVYLTHTEWVPGNPPQLTWVLPEAGYAGFTFKLQALMDGVVICTDEATVGLPAQQFVCPEIGLEATMVDPVERIMRASWTAVDWVDGYQLTVYATDAGGVETEQYTSATIPNDVTTIEFRLPDGYASFRFVLRLVGSPLPCEYELVAVQQSGPPCAVRTDRTDVAVRVGPGLLRGHFMFLPPGVEYVVIGQAADETGMLWWQLDKTQFAGHEAVISLWVAQDDVEELGVCTQIPQAEIPPVIPEPEEPPEGAWGPCGSCDTCGHPANECVTSPEGLCLWDPATCRPNEPAPGDDDDVPVCYSVSVAIDMGNCFGGGSVSLDTPPNCGQGGYMPGTSIQAHATANDQKCEVKSWSGCHAGGATGPTVTFTPTHSCTLVAHMGY
ncbi:MAG: hypothetical protein IPM16_00690 [Chloroflexi bacterium]|nr:hypothetical protein [Chloroflexota bacterium]